jgi:DNA polymerase-3 subunit delta
MASEFRNLITSLQHREFAPVYLIDGEEPYYIDRITEFFEDQILPPHERDFNLLVMYGPEVTWTDVVNACRRFPMFAEKQVVILKDAARMNSLNELVGYLEHPAPTTIFLIEHRFKKVDGRSKLATIAKKKAVCFTSNKVKDEDLPSWIEGYGQQVGFKIARADAETLATFLGNDLQKITNEIEKIRINVPEAKELSSELIRRYIGVSREYNLFDYPTALLSGNAEKYYRMLHYFMANPKNAPIPLLLGTFYNQLNALYKACFAQGKDAASAIGVPPFRVKDVMAQAQRLGPRKIENALLLLADTSARFVGIGTRIDEKSLLQEFTGKMEAILAGHEPV